MARVLVAHYYHLGLDPHEQALGRPYPPLTTVVAATRARQLGHVVGFYDATFASDPALFARALSGWDHVAILGDDLSVPNKIGLAPMRQAAQVMIGAARGAGCRVLAAGPDVAENPDVYLAAGADGAVVGDATEVLTEWLDRRTDITGLAGQGGAGGRRPVITDLDALPDPDWSLLDLLPYARAWRASTGKWELNLSAARGCPFSCNWCAKPTWGRSYHTRSPERVAAEMTRLLTSHRPDRLWFTDDIFAIDAGWLARLRRALPAPVPYRCLSRADLLRSEGYVDNLVATGCEEVWLGAESGADGILQAMHKEQSTAQIRGAAALLRRKGVAVGLFLQLGYPGETLEDVLATVRMVRELRPDHIGVSVTYPHVGTELYERVRDQLSGQLWVSSMANTPLFTATYGEPFYAAAREVLRSEHSASRRPEAVRAFLAEPCKATLRRLAGAAFHTLRLPLVHGDMRRRAHSG